MKNIFKKFTVDRDSQASVNDWEMLQAEVTYYKALYDMHIDMDFDTANNTVSPRAHRVSKVQEARFKKHADNFTQSDKYNTGAPNPVTDHDWWHAHSLPGMTDPIPFYPTIHKQMNPKDGPGNVCFGPNTYDDLSNTDTLKRLETYETTLLAKEDKDLNAADKKNKELMLQIIKWRDTKAGWERLKEYGVTPFMDTKKEYNDGATAEPVLFPMNIPAAYASVDQQKDSVKEWWVPDEGIRKKNRSAQDYDVEKKAWPSAFPAEQRPEYTVKKTPTDPAHVQQHGALKFGYGTRSYSDVSPIRSLPWADNTKVLTDEAPPWKAPP